MRYSKNTKVIPIHSDNDYIFKGKSIFPTKGYIGFLVYFLYSSFFVALTCTAIIIKEKEKKQLLSLNVDQLREDGNFSLVCNNTFESKRYLNYFETLNDVSVIDISVFEANTNVDVPLIQWIKYVCQKGHLNFHQVLKNIEILGIEKEALKKSFAPISEIKKVYLALKIAENSQIFVIYNLFLKESYPFELTCKRFLKESGKKILYISDESIFYRRISHTKYPKLRTVDLFDEGLCIK